MADLERNLYSESYFVRKRTGDLPAHTTLMLPVELYRLIIGHLRYDQATLKACSLTCKTFLHLSRYHLFYYVRLYGGDHTERFLDAISSIHSPTSPGTYVRYLFIYDKYGPWLNKALPLLTTRLPNVTILGLHFRWNALGETQQAMMLTGFQKVTYLRLDSAFDTSAQMTELIASFPLLERLNSSNADWSKYAEPMIPLPQSINKITLSAYHSTFFDQLLNLELHPNVRAIKFLQMHERYAKEINKLLKTLGSHLEDLDVGKISQLSYFNVDGQF
jgi:hypothetical protein